MNERGASGRDLLAREMKWQAIEMITVGYVSLQLQRDTLSLEETENVYACVCVCVCVGSE